LDFSIDGFLSLEATEGVKDRFAPGLQIVKTDRGSHVRVRSFRDGTCRAPSVRLQ